MNLENPVACTLLVCVSLAFAVHVERDGPEDDPGLCRHPGRSRAVLGRAAVLVVGVPVEAVGGPGPEGREVRLLPGEVPPVRVDVPVLVKPHVDPVAGDVEVLQEKNEAFIK